jgi:FAD synthase
MRARLHGRIDAPAVAAIGVWDPLLPAHEELIERLASHARRKHLSAVLVALDPDPVRFLFGEAAVPVYNDVETRVRLLRALGLDAVVRVRFAHRHVEAGAESLLDAVGRCVQIRELWLGAQQTLGRMERGSAATISRLAAERDINVVRLPHRPVKTRAVRQLLQSGSVQHAAMLAGRPPVHRRPAGTTIRLAWCPGPYEAVPVDDPLSPASARALRIHLDGARSGLPRAEWPDQDAKYLAFVAGPADLKRR